MNNASLRRRLPAALLAAFSAATVPIGSVLVAPAHAQTQAQSAPAIQGLEVNADAALMPGSTLEFTVRGTPKSNARVRITRSNVSLPLAESQPGVYTGSYTVKKSDRNLDPKALIRADLTRNGRTSTANFSFPPSFAMIHANTPEAQAQAGPRVDRFVLAPVDRIEPGAELKFTLEGTPGAKASVQVPGLLTSLPMQEEKPGRYVASYTVRKADRIAQDKPIVATLRQGQRVATSSLAQPQTAAAGGSPITTPAPAAPPAIMGAPSTGPLTLQVTSPGPNAAIDSSQLVLQGRTAPGANVRVKVDAVPPTAPGQLAVAQPVTEQTLQADANGNFSLNFGPQRYAPGTRFEVQLSARQGAQVTTEQRLTLFQRQG
jgi:hypothetical protein